MESNKVKTVLITGVAGFIGYSLAKQLTERGGYRIVGIDNLNNYYDTKLKQDRLLDVPGIEFFEKDINDDLDGIFKSYNIDSVINLAAQAGVRYSRENPDTYMDSNVNGFYNLIKTANAFGVKKIIYASSSSVYGANDTLPFKESDAVVTPMSLYAATKLTNESIASGFFFTHGMRTIGLRFFNIYGPFGRPDMAYFKWTNKLLQHEAVELNNSGNMWRDMTFIDDCVESIRRLIDDNAPELRPEIYNIGNKDPVRIGDLLELIANELGIKPNVISTQAGDEEPLRTWADTRRLYTKINFEPNTSYDTGVRTFLRWHKDYYRY